MMFNKNYIFAIVLMLSMHNEAMGHVGNILANSAVYVGIPSIVLYFVSDLAGQFKENCKRSHEFFKQ